MADFILIIIASVINIHNKEILYHTDYLKLIIICNMASEPVFHSIHKGINLYTNEHHN